MEFTAQTRNVLLLLLCARNVMHHTLPVGFMEALSGIAFLMNPATDRNLQPRGCLCVMFAGHGGEYLVCLPLELTAHKMDVNE